MDIKIRFILGFNHRCPRTFLTTLVIHKATHGEIWATPRDNLLLHMRGQMPSTSLLINAFVFSLHKQTFLFFQHPKFLIIFCCWTVRFSLDFVGYTRLVSQDAAYPMFCFSNMFFESFHHHSRVTHMYIRCLAFTGYMFSVVLPIWNSEINVWLLISVG